MEHRIFQEEGKLESYSSALRGSIQLLSFVSQATLQGGNRTGGATAVAPSLRCTIRTAVSLYSTIHVGMWTMSCHVRMGIGFNRQDRRPTVSFYPRDPILMSSSGRRRGLGGVVTPLCRSEMSGKSTILIVSWMPSTARLTHHVSSLPCIAYFPRPPDMWPAHRGRVD